MQQFQVPQFIDVEDKIFGQLTAKQFLYLLGGGAFMLVFWLMRLPTIILFFLMALFGGFFGALAFAKVNGQPFVVFLNNAANHYIHQRIYIWKRREKKAEAAAEIAAATTPYTPKLTKNALKELSWSLDIKNVEHRR
ncbi:MAG: PrgI family protein [Patescibacteria group bacterium]